MRYYYTVVYQCEGGRAGRTFFDTDKPINSSGRWQKLERDLGDTFPDLGMLFVSNIVLLRKSWFG